MLVGDQIVSLELVRPCNQENLKNSTFDLTIGELFPMGLDGGTKAQSLDEFWLEPSCMLAVRTTERIVLPDNVTGLATLVTSLTHDGLLCLNVGIIDPGYDGHLSAYLVNFSRRPRKICLRNRLFRVLFFEHNPISKLEPWVYPKLEYQAALTNRATNEFSKTFLDFNGITELAEKSAWKIVLESATSKWLPPISLIVAILSLGVAAFSYYKVG
ncbi:hypothetical protein [Shimia sp.]|uniref:dCTP deaminase domain-containing protein n=1 Tax=Shimia sp. TaxID=1954381 RepID=UPI003296FFEF